MAKKINPTPKTQKQISKSLPTPYDKGRGNPNDAIPEIRDRAQQISYKDDTTKPFTVGLEDLDQAVLYYLDNVIKPTVLQNGERLAVPTLYGSPEKWKTYQKDGFLRDLKGDVMAPLIIFKRDSITKNRGITSKVDANFPYNYGVTRGRYTARNAYDNFAVLNNKKPQEQVYLTVVPDYITAKYSFIVFTYYVEHLNSIVEAIQYASDAYWGDPERFKFRAMIDEFGFQSQLNETDERIVRSTFTVTLNGYLIPNVVQKSVTALGKIYTKSQVNFSVETTSSLEQPDYRI